LAGLNLVRYRRKFEIIADILGVAEKGAKKTRIMYIANLSYRLLEKYLEETTKIDFIRLDSGGYKVTEKGRAFLEKYSQFSRKYSKFENDVKTLKSEMDTLERMCRSAETINDKPQNLARVSEALP
jgi:predicted transcriptional regulator